VSRLKITDEGGGRFAIDGDLTFTTIAKDTIKSLTFLASAKTIIIDLSRVTNTDSAGLALMIECIKQARSNRTTLTFCNIPKQLLNLAKISGFDNSPYFTSQLEN